MSRPTTLRTGLVALLLCAPLALSAGCGDDAASGTTPPSNNDAGNNGPNNGPDPSSTLTRIGDKDQEVAASSRLDLMVELTDPSGAPIASEAINWTIVGDGGDSGFDAQQSTTNSSGIASVQLLSGPMEAIFDVQAAVANQPDIAPVLFTITVKSKDFASYRVVVNYDGPRFFSDQNVKVALFEDPEACTDMLAMVTADPIHPLRLLNASRTDSRPPDAGGFPMTFNFMNLPNGTSYTAVAVAYADANDGSDGNIIASWGCNEMRPVITNGENPDDVVVDMNDLLPDIDGSWNIKSNFDLTEALPQNVQDILNPILDFFQDPSGTLTMILFDFLEEEFGFDAGSIGTVLEAVLEALLDSLAESNETVRQVLLGAGDISEVVRNFLLEGRMDIDAEDYADNGVISDAELEYSRMAYRWRASCTAEMLAMDPNCGFTPVDFGLLGLSVIESDWNGGVTANDNYDPNTGRDYFHHLTVQEHGLTLNYGAIIAYIIEKVVLPTIFNDPNIDSINALLSSFINCPNLFEGNNTLINVCDAALQAGSDALRDVVTDLQYDADRFTLSTPATTPCALYEQEPNEYGNVPAMQTAHKPRFSRMGQDRLDGSLPAANQDRRCLWEANIQFGDDPNDATSFTGRWSGTLR